MNQRFNLNIIIGISIVFLLSGCVSSEQMKPIKGQFTLEVTSPGIDRPLFNLEQFSQFVGSKVKLRLYHAIEGRRKFTGVIDSVEGENIIVKHTWPKQGNFDIRVKAKNSQEYISTWSDFLPINIQF